MARRIDTYLKDLLSEERFDFYSMVRDFSDNEIAPKILQWERDKILLPDECVAAMGKLGLFGIPIDEKYGGQGGDDTDLLLMGLALGYHSQSVAITPGAAISLGAKPLQICGTEEQKRAHLPDLASGKRMFVFGLSEPGRGSDAANPEVTARREGDGWTLNGEKCWSTNARWASHVIAHALTDPGGSPGKRSTCFIVPMDADGVVYQEMSGKRVWEQSSTGSISFDGVKVPESMHGMSLVSTLRGERSGSWRDALYYRYHQRDSGRINHTVAPHYGVRTARHKLLRITGTPDWELYDLERDPDELNNVYGDEGYAEVRKRLERRLAELREEFGEQ